jgi:two-component system chemotaxis response regulator CheB
MTSLLIVDDSRAFQYLLKKALESLSDIHIAGSASNGRQALLQMNAEKIDIVTLDVEMPIMDGLQTLKAIRAKHPNTFVIMVSSLTGYGAKVTLQALEDGAFDFIHKPDESDPERNFQSLKEQLVPIIQSIQRKIKLNSLMAPKTPAKIQSPSSTSALPSPASTVARRSLKPTIIGIGISTGGPNALKAVLPALPASFQTPIVLVQHMPPLFTQALAESLDKVCSQTVREAQQGERILNGHIYIAPGGKHMKVEKTLTGGILHITDDPPERNCKPSVDVLFRSLAEGYGAQTLAVIMTGMGSDGTAGLKALKAKGAAILAQDEATSTVYGMPYEAVKAGVVDEILPLSQLSFALQKRTSLTAS